MDAPARVGAEIGGRFVLEARLGAGTYGTVWRARDRARPGPVALKLLNAERLGHAISVERFRREAEILARLDHPAIVRAYAWAIDDAQAWLAMELVDGEPLSAVLGDHAARGAPLGPADVVAVVGAIADALAHAHAHGVVHRDLKPRNVMVTRGPPWKVTVLDFGVAKLVDTPKGDATTVGRLLGSLLFMSPEQLGASEIDARTDVFALATLAFELVTLHRAWAHDAEGQLLRAVDAPVGRDRVNNHTTIMARITQGPRPSVAPWATARAAAIDAALAEAWAVRAAERTADPRLLARRLAEALGVAESERREPADLGATEATPSAAARPTTAVARLMEGIAVAPDRAGRALATAGVMAAAVGIGWAMARLSLAGDAAPVAATAIAGPGVIVEPRARADGAAGASAAPRAVDGPRATDAHAAAAPLEASPGATGGAALAPSPSAAPPRPADPAARRAPRPSAAPSGRAASPGAATPSTSTDPRPPTRIQDALLDDARARVRAAHARPDGPEIADAADAITRAAAVIPAEAERRRVLRLAEGARLTAQLDALDAAEAALIRALGR